MEPLLQSSLAIRVHVATALLAAIAGLIIFLAPKGTGWHRSLGRIFVLAMSLTALSSFLIHEIRVIGPFSPIHLLSLFVLFSLIQAVQSIRRGNVRTHQQAMISTYIGGIVIAGGFTFLPGRMMAKVAYGGAEGRFPIFGLFLALLAAGIFLWLVQHWQSRQRPS